jgi:hypothetical protein
MKRRVCGRAFASKTPTPGLERPVAEWRSSAGSLLNTSPGTSEAHQPATATATSNSYPLSTPLLGWTSLGVY